MHKPIKITVRRPEPEPADFVQKIHLGTTSEEEAEQEDSTEPLERHPPKRGREQRAKDLAPPVGGTQQRAKEPTPLAEEEGEKEEAKAAPKEAASKQVLPDFGREQLFQDLGRTGAGTRNNHNTAVGKTRTAAGATKQERAKHPDRRRKPRTRK